VRKLRRSLVIGVVGAALLVAAGCGGEGNGGEAASNTVNETTAPTETTTATVETTTTAQPVTDAETTTAAQPQPATTTPAPKTVKVTVRDGRAVGGIARPTIGKGERVVLVVSSDVADEVHLHGYDLMVDVTPGTPARLRFTATIPGRFEVELEDHGLQIADVEVRP
jgi:heme/copper-type cytochrome/quinol oxidase subunit 2